MKTSQPQEGAFHPETCYDEPAQTGSTREEPT